MHYLAYVIDKIIKNGVKQTYLLNLASSSDQHHERWSTVFNGSCTADHDRTVGKVS